MFRLASSTVFRAISTCRVFSGSIVTSQHLLVKSFCSDAKTQNDLKLVKIMKSKIKSTPFIDKTMPEAPADFPFAIHDDGISNMILTRDLFDGEKIEVKVQSPFGDKKNLPLIMKISKQNGTKMELKVSVCAKNIIVNSITVMEYASNTDDLLLSFGPYGVAPDHREWQVPLKEYVESRGIRNTYFEFLWELVQRKSKRRPREDLEMLTSFLED